MKIQLDTSAKTIRIEQNVKLDELIKILNKLFPKGEWKEYTLEPNSTIYWTNPIYIQPEPLFPTYPQPYPWITYSDVTGDYSVNQGTFNIQL